MGNAVQEAELARQWANIYAGRGGVVGNTRYNPGYTPQGPVTPTFSNYSRWDQQPIPTPLSGNASYEKPGTAAPVKSAEQLAQERADKLAAEERAADLADPFRKQRGQYQTQLSQLTSDPTSFLQSGLNKATTDAGLQGINRLAAAKGQLNSGNRLMDLMNYGQAAGGENYFKQAGLLSTLSGATTGSPAAAAASLTASERLAQEQQQYQERRATEEARYQQERMDQDLEKKKLEEQLSLAQQNAKNSASTQQWLANNNAFNQQMNYFTANNGQGVNPGNSGNSASYDYAKYQELGAQISDLKSQAEQARQSGQTLREAQLKTQIAQLEDERRNY